MPSLGYSVWGASNPHLEEKSFAHSKIMDEFDQPGSKDVEKSRKEEPDYSRDDKPWMQPLESDQPWKVPLHTVIAAPHDRHEQDPSTGSGHGTERYDEKTMKQDD